MNEMLDTAYSLFKHKDKDHVRKKLEEEKVKLRRERREELERRLRRNKNSEKKEEFQPSWVSAKHLDDKS